MRKALLALSVSTMLGLVACGGTGAGAGGSGDEVQSPGTPEVLQDVKVTLSASSQQLASDGSTPVELTAILTDAATGVAIASKAVAFAVRDDAAGVRLEVIRAETDASGVAAARLLLNGNGTERDVTVLASVDQKTPAELVVRVAAKASGDPVSNNSRGELTVRLGTDNQIEDLATLLSYRKRYAAIVTDNAGIPKANVTVLATLRSKRYYVGYWTPIGGGTTVKWRQVQLIIGGLPSEDVADFGKCNAAEDFNNDKVLTPGNVASYTLQSQTDANGVAVLSIVYPKSFALWAQMELEVTATVGGTEGYNAITIPLPVLGTDIGVESLAPPSIYRTRESLSTSTVPLAPGEGEEASMTDIPAPAQFVAGSPFPYLSVTPTCP